VEADFRRHLQRVHAFLNSTDGEIPTAWPLTLRETFTVPPVPEALISGERCGRKPPEAPSVCSTLSHNSTDGEDPGTTTRHVVRVTSMHSGSGVLISGYSLEICALTWKIRDN